MNKNKQDEKLDPNSSFCSNNSIIKIISLMQETKETSTRLSNIFNCPLTRCYSSTGPTKITKLTNNLKTPKFPNHKLTLKTDYKVLSTHNMMQNNQIKHISTYSSINTHSTHLIPSNASNKNHLQKIMNKNIEKKRKPSKHNYLEEDLHQLGYAALYSKRQNNIKKNNYHTYKTENIKKSNPLLNKKKENDVKQQRSQTAKKESGHLFNKKERKIYNYPSIISIRKLLHSTLYK